MLDGLPFLPSNLLHLQDEMLNSKASAFSKFMVCYKFLSSKHLYKSLGISVLPISVDHPVPVLCHLAVLRLLQIAFQGSKVVVLLLFSAVNEFTEHLLVGFMVLQVVNLCKH